ncbi:MAG: hypothetical protein F2529_04510 [Actinobacteria bacterium]|uniref:Unannotated protein n=1 Tax=freshwater metagenome TaxID=449393 RepID=A0A6J6C6C8_9ZZZZ|nr:hypothetical protein [Actinomycetota bacterium]
MNRSTRTLLAVIISAVLSIAGLVASPANAVVDWVSAPTWKNLHAKIEDGVFERVKREFDTSSTLLVDSETQHNIAWVRTDRNSVTVQYQGGLTNAGKQVQFVMSGDVEFTDSIDDPDNIAITDEFGVAEVTLTLSVAPEADTDLRVGLSSGEGDAITTVGNLVLDWQDPGFYPIIKLVGSGRGFESQCIYREVKAGKPVSRAHECTNGGFQEFTWAWSVFKKDWLPEYSQVYVKSYKYGSTLNLTYRVTDIWGTPQVDRDVHLIVDLGCRLCRWYSYNADKATDANGMVSFSVRNKNSLNDVKNNKFVNSDTKAKEGGFIAFSIQPTTNALDESADYIWPQLVTDVNIKASASTVTTVSRGGQDVNASGNYVTTIDGQSVTNPALTLDTLDNAITDIDVVTMNISYMKNSLVKALYSPEIQVTADNGGKAALFDILRPIAGLTSSASFSSPLIFEYTYPQKIALMCTKTGITTFKIITGTAFKTHTMSCKNSLTDAKFIEALPAPIAVPGTPAQQYFKVTDRWGNPVVGATVRFSTSGAGSLTNVTDAVSWNDGIVTADVTSTDAGTQVVTATIQDPDNVTQIASGTATITSSVVWGAQAVTLAPAAKKVTFNFFNLVGSKATILEGKVKSYFNVTLPSQTFVKKYAKGKHTLKITVGTVVKTVTVTVP